MPIERNELRRVMGHFATGVAVITTFSSEGVLHGMTANSLTSVSLDPPLLLACVDKRTESYPCFESSRVFTVNILAEDQEDLSRRFATSGTNKFEGVAYQRGANGCPIIHGALAYLECKLYGACDGGDHTIYIGQIEQAETREGRPLLFFRGGYRSVGD
ncbi:MAG TPA: flavin reductase family protein [Candidatus Binataceae bacterium]|nr:flavin reductase family protein [Candidatus Binataceae bacterium]